jgi:hypothetical protein
MPRVWHVHRADCEVHLRAMERRKNAHRALRQDQETRRAGVLEERPPGVVPLRARNARCPAHPGEPLYGCIVCADMGVDR